MYSALKCCHISKFHILVLSIIICSHFGSPQVTQSHPLIVLAILFNFRLINWKPNRLVLLASF